VKLIVEKESWWQWRKENIKIIKKELMVNNRDEMEERAQLEQHRDERVV
jgi:hypothetical protein